VAPPIAPLDGFSLYAALRQMSIDSTQPYEIHPFKIQFFILYQLVMTD
jgi:hypothetical protein